MYSVPGASDEKPNILFIQADQLTPFALPFYGHSLVKTPHLDKLAKEGVIFDSAYCNSPLCAPSRFSMLSGQLASRIGAYDNAAEFSSCIPTFAHYLRDLGYYTCLAGKMHFVGPDQLHGFEERLTTDIYPADFGWTPDWENSERPSWYHNMLSVVQAGTCEVTNQLDFDEEVAFHANRKISEIARNQNTTNNRRPFFMVVSFTHPHDPYAIPAKYWDLYKHEEIDLPAVPTIPVEQLDPHSKRVYDVCAMGEYAQTDDRVKNARHAYYGSISYVDEKVGQLLRTLETHGLRENTLVVFTSDHGDMLGERGMWYKMSFFEPASRVPLLFHYPKQFQPHRVSDHVSLVDLLPTLVELVAPGHVAEFVDAPAGHSLVPLLSGHKSTERTVVAELLSEGAIAPQVMIRRGVYKYIFSASDPEQLFDLEKDPHELVNLAEDLDYAEVKESFKQTVMHGWNIPKLHQEVLASQRRRRLIDRALNTGKKDLWDFQPHDDATQKYMRNHLDLNVLERAARFPSPVIPHPDGATSISKA